MHRKIVPDVVNGQQSLCCLGKKVSVREAVDEMVSRHIGAVLVVDGDALIGIVTERDVVRRVVGADLDAKSTTLGDIMTPDPQTLAPTDLALDALRKMQEGGFRHLPVLDDGRVCGMVSVRDIYDAVRGELEEDLKNVETLVYGEAYGTSG